MSTTMIFTCEVCMYWDKSTWLCSNPKIGGASHNAQGMRLDEDDCIKPSDDHLNPVKTELYSGPNFGCIHHE